jgi:hypothetical protein
MLLPQSEVEKLIASYLPRHVEASAMATAAQPM